MIGGRSSIYLLAVELGERNLHVDDDPRQSEGSPAASNISLITGGCGAKQLELGMYIEHLRRRNRVEDERLIMRGSQFELFAAHYYKNSQTSGSRSKVFSTLFVVSLGTEVEIEERQRKVEKNRVPRGGQT